MIARAFEIIHEQLHYRACQLLVLIGVARFAQLAHNGTSKRPPTEAILSDAVVLASAFAWGIAAVIIIYFPEWLT